MVFVFVIVSVLMCFVVSGVLVSFWVFLVFVFVDSVLGVFVFGVFVFFSICFLTFLVFVCIVCMRFGVRWHCYIKSRDNPKQGPKVLL